MSEMNKAPEMTPEMLRKGSDLAAQAALRAQQMQRKSAESKIPPEVPARGDGGKSFLPPEIPPKRLNLKKNGPPETSPKPVPKQPPPLPQKPVNSVAQNSPQVLPKLSDNNRNSPQLGVRPPSTSQLQPKFEKPLMAAPQVIQKFNDKVVNAPIALPKFGEKITNSPQFTIRNQNSPQLNQRPNISNSPITLTNKTFPKSISPSEDHSSEDALRGIESGLRNMERAMQEQMNLRSIEAASNHHNLENLNFRPMDFTKRAMGSITSLDGSSQNMRAIENLRLGLNQNMRSMERGFSMDQMRLENLHHGNPRIMESNPNIRSAIEEMKMKGIVEHNNRPVEHHMRSLDRNLPLELQYSRHRSQEIADFRDQFRQLNNGGNGIASQPRQGGLSREDLRIRRRSSHDENQISQGVPVTRLREHWDETSQGALQRKSALTSMLGDSQRYESKRLEIEAWLARMETRSEHMGPVGTTADILEAQQKEQKSFHAELHQYKYHIELFSQLTQKLIKVYHTDDTSRIKRMTESVNLRYNSLNNGVINRGKLLHAAVNNLQSFDRNMDQFLAWLSEAESACENAEQEIERKPHIIMVSTACKNILLKLVNSTSRRVKLLHRKRITTSKCEELLFKSKIQRVVHARDKMFR